MSRLLLAKTRPVGFPFVTWKSLISYRAERFLAGDWQALWNEAAVALVGLAQRKEMSNELKETLAEMRAFNGDLTGCFRTLQSGKLMQASSSPEVAEEWRNKVSVAGRRPTRTWQEVAISRGFDPNDPRFTFTLGTSTVMGTDGPVEVNTLEHVMGHLPKRSAGGADGAGFDLYSCMDASSVEPFVQFFLSPLSPLDERDILGRTVRILLASGLGVGLDKKGLGRPVDLRPLGLGDSLRRISTRCISLQS